MSTAEAIWGFIWRASLYGMLFGAAFGGFFGAAFGTLIFPVLGTAIGLYIGAPTGAVVGLPLGMLDGLLLFWLATIYQNAGCLNSRRYQLQARIVCVAESLLALLIDGALHGLPQPNSFATGRASLLVLDLFLPTTRGGSRTPADAITLILWVLVALLMLLLGSWLTGRFVAKWYLDRVSDT